MKRLEIGFSRSTKRFAIISWLIRLYQKTSYSHIFFKVIHKPLFGVDTILHSNGASGVSYYSETVFLEKNKYTDMFELEISEDIYREIRAMCHQHLGRKYGFLQNIGILLVDIGIFKRNPWQKGFNCSEIAFIGLSKVYPELQTMFKRDTVKPSDIYSFLMKKAKKIL